MEDIGVSGGTTTWRPSPTGGWQHRLPQEQKEESPGNPQAPQPRAHLTQLSMQGRFLTTIEGWAGRYPGWALGGGGLSSRYLYCRYCYINYINYSLLYVHWRKKKKKLSWAA